MAGIPLPLQRRSFGETRRRDLWWVQPIVVLVGLSAFIIYSTWAAFQGEHYTHGPYLSPFYSPELFGNSEHAWFGGVPSWWPGFLPYSPAFLILWAPAGFRVTCYYYRGAYYKAFWADPPNCAVGEPRKNYIGESNWPLRIQNIHRYFMYIAVLFIGVLTWDAIKSFRFHDGFGIAPRPRPRSRRNRRSISPSPRRKPSAGKAAESSSIATSFSITTPARNSPCGHASRALLTP